MDASIRVRKDECSGTIIFDRTDRCNAISSSMVKMIRQALDDFSQEKSVKLVVLTGAGDYFSTGVDLKELGRQMQNQQSNGMVHSDVMKQWDHDIHEMLELVETLMRFPKPILSAVNGPAMGFAAGLVLASDFVLAGEKASLSWPETRWGLVPGLSAPLLSRRLGSGRSAWWLSSGLPVDCSLALRLGLFDQEVDTNFLWAKTQEIAALLATNSDGAIGITRRLLCETIDESVYPQLAVGAANTAASRATFDGIQGVEKFCLRDKQASKTV